MVDFDYVNPRDKSAFLAAKIKNIEEELQEIEKGLKLAQDRQIQFVKVGEMKSNEYRANSVLLDDIKEEFEMRKQELANVRREKSNL